MNSAARGDEVVSSSGSRAGLRLAGAARAPLSALLVLTACAAPFPLRAQGVGADAREIVAVVVERSEARGASVEVPCRLEAAVRPDDIGTASGADAPRERVLALLEVLAHVDPQRADAYRTRLDELELSRRFVRDESLRAALVETHAVASDEALDALLGRAVAAAPPEGFRLELLSARVPGDRPGQSVLLVDDALWGSLGRGRQAILLFTQLAAAEAEATGDATLPCVLLSVLAAPDASSLTVTRYYEEMANRRHAASAPAAAAAQEVKRPVRFDLLFNPMNKPQAESRRKRVGGYELRPVGLIDWGARAEIGYIAEESDTRQRPEGTLLVHDETLQRVFAGADFDGYFYHPKIVRWGATVGVIAELGDQLTDETGGLVSRDTRYVSPQVGFSALALRDQATSFRASYNLYRVDNRTDESSYTVTDVRSWMLGANFGLKLIPGWIEISGDSTDESDRTTGRQRENDQLRVEAHAEHAAGISRTQLHSKWRSLDQSRVHQFDGDVQHFSSSRELQRTELSNDLALRGGKDRLETRLRHDTESGSRSSRAVLGEQTWFVRHAEKLSALYGWEAEDRSFGAVDAQAAVDATSRSAFANLLWRPRESLSFQSVVQGASRSLGELSQEELRADVDARWARAFKHVRLGLSGGATYLTSDESGMSGAAPVFDERHRLSGQDGDLLDHPDVVAGSVVVTSEDAAFSYELDVDYRLTERGGLLEITRIDTGTIPDGAVVRVDYTRELLLRAPLSYDRQDVRLAAHASLFNRVQIGARWLLSDYGLDEKEAAGSRLYDLEQLVLTASGRLGPLELHAEHEDYRRQETGFTADTAGLSAQWQIGVRQSMSAAASWTATDFNEGRDYTSWGTSVTYSLTPGGRWPSVRVSGGYHPFDATDYEGEPYEAEIEMLFSVGRFEFSVQYGISRRVAEFDTRDRERLHVLLRRSW